MNKAQRHSSIVENLSHEPSLRVIELAKRYDVSSETIRRDLSELANRGLISRTYGGALRLISQEPALSERQHLMVSERERIARAAVGMIEPDDILMIGGGITTQSFASALALFKEPLTVITPSFGVATTLGQCENIKVQVVPGEFNGKEGLVQGSDTTHTLAGFRATKAILGASGITAEGPSDAAIPASMIYQCMVERSLHTYILADNGKFGKAALSSYSTWAPTLTLVTDSLPEAPLNSAIEAAGTLIMLSPE